MLKILVIEDEMALQMLLEYDLKSSGYEVDLCDDGHKGLEKLENNYYDLALIDWMLPSLSGYEIIKTLRIKNQQLKIIMVTAKDNEMDVVKGLEAGADDYVTKPFSSRELNARIKAQFRERIAGNENVITIDDLVIDKNKRSVSRNEETINLSKIEFELLLYLIKNKNVVISRESIIENIWNINDDVDVRTIDTHISSIKKKLALKNRIITKRGVGYVFVD